MEFSLRLAAIIATLWRMARWMVFFSIVCPSTFSVPPVEGRTPKMVCISSLTPAPLRPVKPTTSPLRMQRLTFSKPWPE